MKPTSILKSLKRGKEGTPKQPKIAIQKVFNAKRMDITSNGNMESP